MDWWQETTYKNIQLACTPAQHFSGRKFNTNRTTLWSSWVIKSDSTAIYFSGDGGYGPHFLRKSVNKYGPFDFAMMECGQYNKMWPDIHMFPEETAQAGIDVQAKAMMPIHWGAFKLASALMDESHRTRITKSRRTAIAFGHPKNWRAYCHR